MIIQAPPNRGYLRGKYRRRGLDDICAVVIHTTGAGIIRRWQKQGEEFGEHDPFDTALRVYHRLMDAGPHFVVGQAGQVAQTCPLDFAAWHVGRKDSRPYWLKNTVPGHQWWHDRWGHSFKSPAEMAGGLLWAGGQCNPNVIGIEVVPEIDDPRGVKFAWRQTAYNAIRDLCKALSDECSNFNIRPDTIIGHADAHPLSRTARGEPWDPTPLQWSPEIVKVMFLQ